MKTSDKIIRHHRPARASYQLQKLCFSIIFPFILLLIITGCSKKYDELDLSMYHYRDTKNLVKFVYDAAQLLKKDELAALDYFRSNRQRFQTKDHYLYIYDMNCNNIFHSGMENLENTNLIDIEDKNGKHVAELTLQALQDPNNPHAWVHYSWWEPGKFYPVPKSSCHFKVTTPEGKELFVGGGINYPQEEQEFIRIIVDNAAELIREKGHAAFEEIADPTSQYNYREVRVFAFHPDGDIVISPVLDDSLSRIQILECTDEVGHKPFVKAINGLKEHESVWEVFMAKNRYRRELVKKCMYLRKTNISGKEIYVGAITDLPNPP